MAPFASCKRKKFWHGQNMFHDLCTTCVQINTAFIDTRSEHFSTFKRRWESFTHRLCNWKSICLVLGQGCQKGGEKGSPSPLNNLWIDDNKHVFNKCTIEICGSCSWHCLGTPDGTLVFGQGWGAYKGPVSAQKILQKVPRNSRLKCSNCTHQYLLQALINF